jgi:MYXO-CTERM domain-containing protein
MTLRLPSPVRVPSALVVLKAALLLLGPAATSRAAISLANGSFETIEGTTLIPPAPQFDIFKPVSWDILTVGTPWDAGSSSVTGGTGNFDSIASGSMTGARYLRLGSDFADSGFGAVAQNPGTMVAGQIYTIKADVFGGNGNVDWTGRVEFRSTGANTGGTVFAFDTAGPLASGAFSADAFTVSYTATAADNGNPLWVRFAVDPSLVNGTAMRGGIDNVRLTTVPEPSAALLAGLAGLGLVRRRRTSAAVAL